ncbi:21401_t:CDS:2, partial [Gigaspora margarita]
MLKLLELVDTVRALHYAKHVAESDFRKYADAFNNYKISLENIKEFAKERVNLERKIIFPYSYVKERYEKLLKEHEDCEKQLHPILIHVVMNKQE